jgi:hypothetical protein
MTELMGEEELDTYVPSKIPAYENPDKLPDTPEGVLALTQSVRLKIVNNLTNDGTKVPKDLDDAKLLLVTLSNMDQVSFGLMKQKTDNTAAAREQLVAQALVELSRRQGNKPLLRDPTARTGIRELPHIDDSSLPEISTVPGEMDVGVQTITYKDLAQKHARVNNNLLEHDPS